MRYTEAEKLHAEISAVERLLKETPEDALIVRTTWEERLELLRERLVEVETHPQAYPLSITFRGAPVEGSRSIDAAFASQAVRAFVEATDTVTASFVAERLRDLGRLPNTGGRSLRIVNTAPGSFGFELELPPPTEDEVHKAPPSPGEPDPHVEAITTTLRLLGEAATDDEDAISDLIAEIHPRAASKIRAFAKVLADKGALFAATFRDEELRCHSEREIKRILEALEESEISQDNERYQGTLLGVLPRSRQFEARLHNGEEHRGKIDRAVEDITAFKRRWVDQEGILNFRIVRVRKRSRFILTGVSPLPQSNLLQEHGSKEDITG